MKARHGGILLCVALLASALFLVYHFTFVSAQQAVIRLDPSSQNVNAGGSFTVHVMLDDVSDLGSYEFTLQFDPSLVAFQTVTNGTFLGSSGRQVYCPSPIVDANLGTVRFGCLSFGTQAAVNGSGELATVTYNGLAEGVSPLDFAMVSLSDPLSSDIPAVAEDGSVIIGSPTPRPTSTPVVPTPSPTAGPTCEGAPAGVVACLRPAGQTAFNDSDFSVDLMVNNVAGLGAFQASLQFDPVIASYVSAEYGPFLGSSGRDVNCDVPTTTGNTVRLACRTLGSHPAGPDGNGILATVTFSAIREGIGLMSLSDFMLTDIAAVVIPTNALLGASVVVEPAPTPTPGPSPTPRDTATPTVTSSPTATRTPRPTWTPGASPTFGPTPTDTPIAGPVTLGVAPAWQPVNVGVLFSVNATMDGAMDLGAYELILRFDPTFLQVRNVQNGPFLGSSGRGASCLPWDVDGPTVRTVCLTLGSEPEGANGSGVLATFTFLPLQMGDTQVIVEKAIATNPMAGVMAVTIAGAGSLTIGPAPTPADTPLPTETFTPGPSPTPTITPMPTATATLGPDVPAVVIDPPSQDLTVGDYFTVDVMARNVANVAAYEFTLEFDSNVMTLSGVSNGTFLGRTGRPVFCPAPAVGDGRIRFGCVSSGSAPGASGTGLLAEITFQASGIGRSSLDLPASVLADPFGKTVNAAVVGGSVSVSAPGAASPLSNVAPRYMAVAVLLTGMVGLLMRPTGVRPRGRKRLKGMFRGSRQMLDRMKSLLRRTR